MSCGFMVVARTLGHRDLVRMCTIMNHVNTYSTKTLAEFLMQLDRLMSWYEDIVLPRVVDHLFQLMTRSSS